jgi:hypothetical protein
MDINIGVRLSLGNLKGAAGQISGVLLGEQRKVEAGNRSAGKSFDNISQGARKAGLSMQQIGTAAAHANSTVSSSTGKSTSLLNRMGSTAGSVTGAVHRIGGAAGSVGRVGDAASATAKKLDTAGAAGAKAGSNISKGMSGATSAVGELSGMIGGLVAGFGAVEIGQAMWTGAMDKQFNQAYLAMHLGTQQAAAMTKEIQNIVAAVPGDDTFMNTLLVDAAVRNANLQDMQSLAVLAADYLAAAAKTGMTQIEAQQDLNAYILTGNTAELARSRILKGQLEGLEGKETIQERILALQKALEANNLAGLSTLDVAKIKWEAIKGRIQMAATSLGEKFLPTLEAGMNWFIAMDEATGGMAGQIAVVSGLVISLVGSLGLISGPIKTGIGLFQTMGGSITGATGRAKDFITSFRTGGITGIIDKFKDLFRGRKKVNVDCASSTCGSYFDLFGGKKSKAGTAGTAGATGTAAGLEATIGTILASSLTGPLIGVAAGLVTTVVLKKVMDEQNQKIIEQAPPKYREIIREILPAQSPALNPPDQSVPVEQRKEQFYSDYNIPNTGNWLANLGWGVTGTGAVDYRTLGVQLSKQQPWTLGSSTIGLTGTSAFPSLGGWNITDWFTGDAQKQMSPWDWFQGVLNPFKGFNLNQLPSLNKSALESWIGSFGSGDWLGGGIGNPLDWFTPKPVGAASGAGKPSFTQDIQSMWDRGFGKGSWFDTSNWKLPEFKLPEFKWPEIHWPEFKWPDWLPKINIPQFRWPEINWASWLPKISLPEWSWPVFTWPVIPVPDLSGWIPDFGWPQIPNIDLSDWIPKFNWPKIPSINLSKWIPRFSWPKIPSLNLSNWIPKFTWPKIPIPNLAAWIPSFHWPNVNFDLIGFIKSKIPAFHWPFGPPGFITGLMSNAHSMINQAKAAASAKAAAMAKQAVVYLQNPITPPSPQQAVSYLTGPWEALKKFFGWGPPRGPAGPAEEFNATANELIRPGMYIPYGGSAIDPITAILGGGNCFDMSLGLIGLGQAKGLSGDLVWGSWEGQSHVWANIGGRDYDPAMKSLYGVWSPPPQPAGPGSVYGGKEIHIHLEGASIYGMKDFEKKVESAVDKIIR